MFSRACIQEAFRRYSESLDLDFKEHWFFFEISLSNETARTTKVSKEPRNSGRTNSSRDYGRMNLVPFLKEFLPNWWYIKRRKNEERRLVLSLFPFRAPLYTHRIGTMYVAPCVNFISPWRIDLWSISTVRKRKRTVRIDRRTLFTIRFTIDGYRSRNVWVIHRTI